MLTSTIFFPSSSKASLVMTAQLQARPAKQGLARALEAAVLRHPPALWDIRMAGDGLEINCSTHVQQSSVYCLSSNQGVLGHCQADEVKHQGS
jgi:hypothetical protein